MNPFQLFGYSTLAVLTNLQIAAFYYVAINPLGVKGFKYSDESDLIFTFQVLSASCQISQPIGYFMFLAYLVITVLTILLMWPIYEKFLWDIYQLIGLENTMQRAFKTIQIAKSTFLIFFLFTFIQLANLIYFEKSMSWRISYFVVGVVMLVSIRLGLIAVFTI